MVSKARFNLSEAETNSPSSNFATPSVASWRAAARVASVVWAKPGRAAAESPISANAANPCRENLRVSTTELHVRTPPKALSVEKRA